MSNIRVIEASQENLLKRRIEELEHRQEKVKGILAAVVASISSDQLTAEDARNALLGALDVLRSSEA